MLAHFLDNVTGRFFHIQTASRINAEMDIMLIASLGLIGLTVLAWAVSKRANLRTLQPWEINEL